MIRIQRYAVNSKYILGTGTDEKSKRILSISGVCFEKRKKDRELSHGKNITS